MRRSISYPHLSCTRDGKFYFHDTLKPLRVLYDHSLSINGPVVYLFFDNRTHFYSAARILYEAYIHEKPLKSDQTIVFRDGDEWNIDLSNLSIEKRGTVKRRKTRSTPDPEFDTWLGPDSIY